MPMMDFGFGTLVRAWNGKRPKSSFKYCYGTFMGYGVYGKLVSIGEGQSKIFDHIEFAAEEPEWNEDNAPATQPRRRVIKDKIKLLKVLVDQGYLPDHCGHFRKPYDLTFVGELWAYCGEPVERVWTSTDFGQLYQLMGESVPAFDFKEEWTEEY